ncbi:MAG: type II secretion system protein GspF, partial [Gammaproteobacteria bacterium]|nr:type II secretion system protein GspF [Gammaproteobacteria bacterium]
IVTFLLIYVVPKIIAVFSQTSQKLPLETSVLIAVSNFVQHDGFYLIICIILFSIFWMRALKRKSFRRKVDVMLLKLPA